jgi:hypothetical protein
MIIGASCSLLILLVNEIGCQAPDADAGKSWEAAKQPPMRLQWLLRLAGCSVHEVQAAVCLENVGLDKVLTVALDFLGRCAANRQILKPAVIEIRDAEMIAPTAKIFLFVIFPLVR